MKTVNFFKMILPDDGDRCAVGIDGEGRVDQRFVKSNHELAETVHKFDQKDINAHHACATFRDNSSRKANNVAFVKSVWLDIDVDEAKSYATQKEAARALNGFIKKLALPLPLILSSGKGLHVYWVLEEPIKREVWQPVADALKASTSAHGLDADPARTADAASLLRPVGTHNRKAEPVPVRVLNKHCPPPVPFKDFKAKLGVLDGPTSELKLASTNINNDLRAGLSYPPSSAYPIADNCPVLGLIRDTRGNVDQPTWFYGLGVLAFTQQAPSICHEWSEGHPEYSSRETSDKIEQVQQFAPTTCEKLGEHQPELCQACPHTGKINSPISLGWVQHGDEEAALGQRLPTPLVNPLPPVERCQLHFLPKPLQALAQDETELLHAPMDFVVTNLLVAALSLVSGKLSVNLKQQTMWLQTPNLWGMCIGDVSSMKTPASKAALRLIEEMEDLDAVTFQSEEATYAANKIIYDAQVAAAKSTAKKMAAKTAGSVPTIQPLPVEPDRPELRRRLTTDASYEAVGALAKNSRGLLVFQDELSGLLSWLNDEKNRAGRAFFLSGWEGQSSYRFDRIGRGHIAIPRLVLSVAGNIQPGVLETMLISGARGGTKADGLAQRFSLITYPDPKPLKFVDQRARLTAESEAQDAFKKLYDLDPVSIGANTSLDGKNHWVNLSDAAYSCFKQWNEQRLEDLADDCKPEAYRHYLGKLPKLVAGVALLIHLLESHNVQIGKQAMQRAIEAAQYYASHGYRVFSRLHEVGYADARHLAKRISIGELTSEFTLREARNNGWRGFQTKEDALAVLAVLEEAEWILPADCVSAGKGGRPTIRWTINPKAKGAPWQ